MNLIVQELTKNLTFDIISGAIIQHSFMSVLNSLHNIDIDILNRIKTNSKNIDHSRLLIR